MRHNRHSQWRALHRFRYDRERGTAGVRNCLFSSERVGIHSHSQNGLVGHVGAWPVRR